MERSMESAGSFSSAMPAVMINVNNLSAYEIMQCLPAFLVSLGVWMVGRLVLSANDEYRRAVAHNPLWKVQFLFHPVIVGGCVYFANSTLPVCGLLVAPFVFNWGVEPYNLADDPLLLFLFTVHHLAPVAACVAIESFSATASSNIAVALVFAHAWLTHSVNFLDHKGVITRDKWIWRYLALDFVLKCMWWMNPGSAPQLLMCAVAVQYGSRWSLLTRIRLARKNTYNHRS